MVSSLSKKSFNDLGKRKARTVFTVLTIALAVGALGLFAVVPLMDVAMEKEVVDSNMYDVRIWVNDLRLNESQMNGLTELDNVNSVEAKSVFYTRMYIGERRNDALIVGVDDFSDQSVDIVVRDSGENPGFMELLTDASNSRANLYNGGAGENARIYDYSGNGRIEVDEVDIERGVRDCTSLADPDVYFPNYVWMMSIALGLVGVFVNVFILAEEDKILPAIPVPGLLAMFPWAIHIGSLLLLM